MGCFEWFLLKIKKNSNINEWQRRDVLSVCVVIVQPVNVPLQSNSTNAHSSHRIASKRKPDKNTSSEHYTHQRSSPIVGSVWSQFNSIQNSLVKYQQICVFLAYQGSLLLCVTALSSLSERLSEKLISNLYLCFALQVLPHWKESSLETCLRL